MREKEILYSFIYILIVPLFYAFLITKGGVNKTGYI